MLITRTFKYYLHEFVQTGICMLHNVAAKQVCDECWCVDFIGVEAGHSL